MRPHGRISSRSTERCSGAERVVGQREIPLKANVWSVLHGVLWALTLATLSSAFVLAQGCYKSWGAPLPHPAPPEDADLEVELRRFPPRAVVASWRETQQRRLDHLYFMAENGWGVRTDVNAAITDQAHRYKCWDKLDDVQLRSGDLGWRNESMDCLKHMIGTADFYAGRMPDPMTAFNPE